MAKRIADLQESTVADAQKKMFTVVLKTKEQNYEELALVGKSPCATMGLAANTIKELVSRNIDNFVIDVVLLYVD